MKLLYAPRGNERQHMHIVEETVKLLCEKSQRPHDDFDVVAQKLGAYGDTLPDPRVITPSERERSIHKMNESQVIFLTSQRDHLTYTNGTLEKTNDLINNAIDAFHAQPWYKRIWQALHGRIL